MFTFGNTLFTCARCLFYDLPKLRQYLYQKRWWSLPEKVIDTTRYCRLDTFGFWFEISSCRNEVVEWGSRICCSASPSCTGARRSYDWLRVPARRTARISTRDYSCRSRQNSGQMGAWHRGNGSGKSTKRSKVALFEKTDKIDKYIYIGLCRFPIWWWDKESSDQTHEEWN